MSDEKKHQENLGDDALLLVSGSRGSKEIDRDYVKKLSNAILQVIYKHDVAKLRCVGAAAVNNAIKAAAIAKTEASKKGEKLVLEPSFTTVTFHGEEKTGLLIEATMSSEE